MINPDDGSVSCESGIFISRHHTPDQLGKLDAHGELSMSKNPYLSEISYITGATSIIGETEFELTIEFHNERIKRIFFKMRHGPASESSWDEVSEMKLKEELKLVEVAATAELRRPPDRKRHFFRSWDFSWGEIQAAAESKSFQCGLFLMYRSDRHNPASDLALQHPVIR
ncbi:MAG: hypothetical protein MEQ07_11955 [Aquimonas sp.]|nr:hypothetical protein [Aquimonas sp.]